MSYYDDSMEASQDGAPKDSASKTELAKERTDWALERTLLANERNFTAWFRTGIAALAAGLAIAKLLGKFGSPVVTQTIGALFLVAAGMIAVMAFFRYRDMHKQLREEEATVAPLWLMGALVVALLAAVALSFALLFSS